MMKAHWAYFKYVMTHKWFVFLACIKMNVPLWRAIIHDYSKFFPREWSPYVHNFFNPDGTRRMVRDSSGSYDPNAQADAFKLAWLAHQKNKHHWQAWISIGDGGLLDAQPMKEVFIREMIADWHGAGRAISGRNSPCPWYEKNKDKIILHMETRRKLHELLITEYGWCPKDEAVIE